MLKRFYPNGFFLLAAFLGIWLCYEWVSRELEVEQDFALTNQLILFKIPQDAELRSLLVKELHRRISYHLYAGKVSEIKDFLAARYSIKKFNLSQEGSSEPDRIDWVETDKNPILKGKLVNESFQAQIEISLTNQWLIDALGSTISSIAQESTNGFLFLLEEGDNRIPERHLIHLKDHALMISNGRLRGLDRFAYSFLRMDTMYGSFHLVAGVDKSLYEQKFWEKFLGLSFLSLLIILAISFFPHLRRFHFSILHRVLVFQFLCFFGLMWMLSEESLKAKKESFQRRRYSRERQVIQGGFSEMKIPSYNEVRKFLPFGNEMIYSLPKDDFVQLFRAREGQLEGTSYVDFKQTSNAGYYLCILLYALAFLSTFWTFRGSQVFFRALAQRIRSFSSHNGDGYMPLRPLFSYRKIYRAFEEMIKAVITHDLHQKSASKWIHNLLLDRFSIEASREPKSIDGTVLWISSAHPFPFPDSNSEIFYANYSNFMSLLRDRASRFSGVPLFDEGWNQGIFFYSKEPGLSRQRAVIAGLSLLNALRLNLTQEPFIGVIRTGSVQLQLLEAENREEVIFWGDLRKSMRQAISECRHGSRHMKHSPLLLEKLEKEPLKVLFDIEEMEMPGYSLVVGVAGIEDHLALLSCDSPELQETALQLCSINAGDRVLKAVLDILPSLESLASSSLREVLQDALRREDGRELIFDKLRDWPDRNKSLVLILEIIREQGICLNADEARTLVSLVTPENRDLCLRIVIESFQQSSIPEFEPLLKTGSPSLQALFLSSEAVNSPDEKFEIHMDPLWELCQSRDENIQISALQNFAELTERGMREPIILTRLRKWYSKNSEGVDRNIKTLLGRRDPQLITYILGALVALETRDMVADLVEIHRSCSSIELKSELALTVKRLGADRFLLENLV